MSEHLTHHDAGPTEEWRRIPGAPHEVSNLGRVRSLARVIVTKAGVQKHLKSRILSTPSSGAGYPRADLSVGGGDRRFSFVHVLVLEAFVGPRPLGQEARHLDGDPMNNRPSNLAWGTSSENNLDQVRHGTHPWASPCKRGHEFTEANTYRNRGRRTCRTCALAADAARRRRAAEQRKAAA